MASRGRAPGFRLPDEHRHKIANSNILTYLIQHVEGSREMGATQVTAAIALLRKVMPDLTHSELSGPDGEPIQLQQIERLIVDPKAPNPDSSGVPPAP